MNVLLFLNLFQLLVVHFSVILTCPSLELLLYNFIFCDSYFLSLSLERWQQIDGKYLFILLSENRSNFEFVLKIS